MGDRETLQQQWPWEQQDKDCSEHDQDDLESSIYSNSSLPPPPAPVPPEPKVPVPPLVLHGSAPKDGAGANHAGISDADAGNDSAEKHEEKRQVGQDEQLSESAKEEML